jgi:DNA repair protein RecO (recombination protein O)
MSQPRNYQTEAIVIKKTKLGEADRILTFYTPHLGKIQAVAKGVRRPKSKMAGHLELLTCSRVDLARGRNLDTVTGAQTINSFILLKNDLNLASYGLYLAELTCQFTPEDQENLEIFELLLGTMERLCEANNKDIILRHFEMQLLNASGFRPQLQQCVKCRQPLQPATNYFSASGGGMLCPSCSNEQYGLYALSANALKVLRLLQNGDLDTVLKLKISPELSFEMEEVVRRYIRYILEKEVKSVAWLDNLKAAPLVVLPNTKPDGLGS